MLSTRLEPGCAGCSARLEEGPLPILHYEETWASEEALRRRVGSDRFTQVLALMEGAAEPPDVQFELATETRGLDFIAEVRGEELS
jgi:quinol monooxygenase YgiN